MKFTELRVHQAVHVTEANGATQKFGTSAEKAILISAKIEKVSGGFTVSLKEGSGYFISDNNVVWARFTEEPKNAEGLKSGLALEMESESKSQKRRMKIQNESSSK